MANQYKRKYHYNLNVFYREDATSYYLLGAFITDGCVRIFPTRKMVRLTSKDLDWLEAIRNLICKELTIKIHSPTVKCYNLDIYSTELANWFISKGCGPRKSLTVRFPKVPKKYLPDLLRGLIDGDGGVYMYNPSVRRCMLCSGSLKLINGFKTVLNEYNINFSFRRVLPKDKIPNLDIKGVPIIAKHTFYEVYINGLNAEKFLKRIYYTKHKLSMPRKNKTAQEIISFYKQARKL